MPIYTLTDTSSMVHFTFGSRIRMELLRTVFRYQIMKQITGNLFRWDTMAHFTAFDCFSDNLELILTLFKALVNSLIRVRTFDKKKKNCNKK